MSVTRERTVFSAPRIGLKLDREEAIPLLPAVGRAARTSVVVGRVTAARLALGAVLIATTL